MTHSKHKFIIVGFVVLVVAFVWFLLSKGQMQIVIKDYKNATYTIEGNPVTLVGGKSVVEIVPGSVSKLTTQYFGNEVQGDFNNDGSTDTAFILTQSGSGSGTFYYLVVALQGYSGWQGSNAVLLGDRIAPQTTEFHDGNILVNYADRAEGEAMSVSPHVGVSRYFKVSGTQLIETKLSDGLEENHDNLIRVTLPTAGATVTSPLAVTGQARGNWYFEASFPVILLDGNGNQIASSPAQAQSDWMTTEFVPFKVILTFTKPTTTNGTLVLKKDNPSGLPDKEDSISIPVRF